MPSVTSPDVSKLLTAPSKYHRIVYDSKSYYVNDDHIDWVNQQPSSGFDTIQLMQMSEIVVDLFTNRILKCRHEIDNIVQDALIILKKES